MIVLQDAALLVRPRNTGGLLRVTQPYPAKHTGPKVVWGFWRKKIENEKESAKNLYFFKEKKSTDGPKIFCSDLWSKQISLFYALGECHEDSAPLTSDLFVIFIRIPGTELITLSWHIRSCCNDGINATFKVLGLACRESNPRPSNAVGHSTTKPLRPEMFDAPFKDKSVFTNYFEMTLPKIGMKYLFYPSIFIARQSNADAIF